MKPGPPKARLRCAIYTRKSSEEGLDQEFNSLDAQRDACAAYIASQAGEGWRLVPDRFDDGGFSGGNMDRPALARLLDAIDRGSIDIIVVYKVDRLTRSLMDFARIVERFDARGASFVSVTQSFNTTTSMGRLTLNVLLSFAQFEREVTGERIRDKIAASKAKGMWMGGRPPLGYNPVGRTLQINPTEAETVRGIFARYLELESVHSLVADLAARDVKAKTWVTRDGRLLESAPFNRGALYHLLRNRLYLGEIVHRGASYPGQHGAIIDAETFRAVQASLDQKANAKRDRPIRNGGSPLIGILFDSAGNRMSPTSGRGNAEQLHRYYVSKALLTGRREEAGLVARVPAGAIEGLVMDRMKRLLPVDMVWSWAEARRRIVRIVLSEAQVEMDLHDLSAADLDDAKRRLADGDGIFATDDVVRLVVPARLKMARKRAVLLDATGRLAVDSRSSDETLVRALARAHAWRTSLVTATVSSVAMIAKEEGCTVSPVHHLLPLAYLSPEVMRAILAGRHRPDLNLEQIVRSGLPASWAAQRRLFGLASAA